MLAVKKGPLLGSFEENVLNKRLEPIRTVDGYYAEVRASGHFEPRPMRSVAQVSYFSAGADSFPYLGQICIGQTGYRIPKNGTLQVTLFNPLGRIEKLFLLMYDLSDMPPNSHTFLRQRTIFISGSGAFKDCAPQINKSAGRRQFSLRYLIQVKSGRIYLNKDVRIFVSKNITLETALQLANDKYELKSFDEMPKNPKYFVR